MTLPRTLGKDEDGNEIISNIGRFGPYVKVKEKFYSVKNEDPYKITLEQAKKVIQEKEDAEKNKIIKEFPDTTIQVLNGRYGPYITDGNKNAKIPKDTEPKDLEQSECEELLKNSKNRRRTRKPA